MCAIGRALMALPRILMLDEPTLGLAPVLVARIFETVRTINGQGVTVLLVEQNVRQALTLAHRACVLESGKLVLEGRARGPLGGARRKRGGLGLWTPLGAGGGDRRGAPPAAAAPGPGPPPPPGRARRGYNRGR